MADKKNKHDELLKHFTGDGYEEKCVDGVWLVKQWNGNTKRWQVAQFSEESFKRYKAFSRGEYQSERRQQISHLKAIVRNE